jgi:hypothetical protein
MPNAILPGVGTAKHGTFAEVAVLSWIFLVGLCNSKVMRAAMSYFMGSRIEKSNGLGKIARNAGIEVSLFARLR